MPENCFMEGGVGVKEIIFDVKIAKIWLFYGENLILKFDESPISCVQFQTAFLSYTLSKICLFTLLKRCFFYVETWYHECCYKPENRFCF